MVHLFNLASVGNIEVTRSNVVTSTQRKLSVQVLVNVSAFSFSVMSLLCIIKCYRCKCM
jgi:hypothetical protein